MVLNIFLCGLKKVELFCGPEEVQITSKSSLEILLVEKCWDFTSK